MFPKKVETFSIGFENEDYDELKKSLKISKMLGLENNIFMMNENDLIDMVISFQKFIQNLLEIVQNSLYIIE